MSRTCPNMSLAVERDVKNNIEFLITDFNCYASYTQFIPKKQYFYIFFTFSSMISFISFLSTNIFYD